MTPVEVADLLRFCSSVDPWLKQTSPEEGAVMVAGWALMLESMPADLAMRTAREHYQQGGSNTITPGVLLDAWAAVRQRERQAGDDHARRVEAVSIQAALTAAGDEGAHPMFGSASQYLADMMAAVAAGRDPSTVSRPANVRVLSLSPEVEARMRACRFPTICLCTHLECRDGWLDTEGVKVNGHGKSYAAVQRCPMCEEGMVMAQEKGVARRPRRTAGAR